MNLVPIRGLFEAHLTVGDLDRAVGFYRDVLGLPLAYRSLVVWRGRFGGGINER